MNDQMKKIMQAYLKDMENITPDHPEYVERNRIALEYAKLLGEEEKTKNDSSREYLTELELLKREWASNGEVRVAEWRRDFDARRMASNSYRDECYRQSESKGPSVGSIVLGVGGAILGILGICALANSSSDGDSYSGIEDYDYDYSDYSSYYTYDDYY